MKKIICAIYDEKAGIFFNPYVSINIETATRDFVHAVTQESDSPLYRYPLDHHLYQLGHIDDCDGHIVPDKQLVISGQQVPPTLSKLDGSYED